MIRHCHYCGDYSSDESYVCCSYYENQSYPPEPADYGDYVQELIYEAHDCFISGIWDEKQVVEHLSHDLDNLEITEYINSWQKEKREKQVVQEVRPS